MRRRVVRHFLHSEDALAICSNAALNARLRHCLPALLVAQIVLDSLKEALNKSGPGSKSPISAVLHELGIKGKLKTLSEQSQDTNISVVASTLLNQLTSE